jgi:hypothetical protein
MAWICWSNQIMASALGELTVVSPSYGHPLQFINGLIDLRENLNRKPWAKSHQISGFPVKHKTHPIL